MWHAARRGARLAASNASTASAARALRGEAASRATGVASSWPAGASDASALARRLDRPSPSGFASAAHAAVAARGASGPRAPPLARARRRARCCTPPLPRPGTRGTRSTPAGRMARMARTRLGRETGRRAVRASGVLRLCPRRGWTRTSRLTPRTTIAFCPSCSPAPKPWPSASTSRRCPCPTLRTANPERNPPRTSTRAAFDALLAEHGYADAASRADATRAFRDAGAVVVLGDLVYLDGAQVTKDILRALPAVPGAVYGLDPETLAELESEMAAIQVDVDAAAARAARRSNAIVFGGLVLLCAQLATFVRLTYVELSWDVMEPISYLRGRLQRHPAVRVLHGQPAGLLLRRLVEAHARALPAPEHRARARRRRSVRGARQEAREKRGG